MRRTRTKKTELFAGDALDFWRVLYANKEEGRLLLFAEDAFVGLQGGLAAVERQVVGYFIDGLHYPYVQLKVMRDELKLTQYAFPFE